MRAAPVTMMCCDVMCLLQPYTSIWAKGLRTCKDEVEALRRVTDAVHGLVLFEVLHLRCEARLHARLFGDLQGARSLSVLHIYHTTTPSHYHTLFSHLSQEVGHIGHHSAQLLQHLVQREACTAAAARLVLAIQQAHSASKPTHIDTPFHGTCASACALACMHGLILARQAQQPTLLYTRTLR
jgi:hypothetical protein